MRIDEDSEHAQGFVIFDEAHAAHVRSQVVNRVRALQSPVGCLEQLKIKLKILHAGSALIPLVQRLDVNGPDILITLADKIGDEVAADKAAAAAHNDFFTLHNAVLE
jgi:hypothetical protein